MKIALNFKDKNTFRKLERQAYDGTIDVTKFPPAEYRYFSELKKLYYAFKFEELPKEEASRKKRILLKLYKEAISEYENTFALQNLIFQKLKNPMMYMKLLSLLVNHLVL